MLQEEHLIAESSTGEVELDMDSLPTPTLRRMQLIVAEKLGKPVPPGILAASAAPAASSSSSTRGGGGGRASRPPGIPVEQQRDLVSRAAAVAQERLAGAAAPAPGPGRTIFDDGE